ncbi:MAG: 1-acyl-sn-glycerol-3-phosphate acyltransferase [Anaerolineales bacterium]|uniref:lysophospholipid acyltransferase family protein n=1 Tax=Candidatus Villigracilis affinis TaxID=3140682 RepID=UPI002A1E4608|nr:1-acyl-sn-glycerol-3-phosphate acyltransferase [Anaerolineales bacterium]MBL0347919.1 1-acyl-sn-glycerol-3-phosphate acyltransferase [Anaerolineales bacterium]
MNFSLHLITFILRVYFRLTLRLDARGMEKVPAQGPLIIISNHTGQIEVPVLATLLQPRKITGWAKAEAFENPFLRWVFGAWGIIPVHRGEADIKSLKLALRSIEKGLIFGIAPEGTRNYTGKLKRALPGAVTLALHSGATIIPIAHWGGEVYLKNLKKFKRSDFHLRVGEPFTIDTKGVKVSAELRQQIVDEMMVQLALLLPEEYRGEYTELCKIETQFIKKQNAD